MSKPRRRPKALWQQTRKRIWQRDQGRCQGPYCHLQPEGTLPLREAHIDHIVELSRGGTHADHNLRTLCRRCHCLRASVAHRGMIEGALQAGIIPPDWRRWVWE